jgi:oligopeptide/dipeptide ABC transporter ATP-binding protein
LNSSSPVPLLVVDDLRTRFDTPAGGLAALDGVSFTLGSGITVGVVGESGSGKSVMARSIMGLFLAGNAETSGDVTLDGVDMMSLSPKELQKMWGSEVSMVFQDPLGSLNPVMKVGKQVGEGMRVHMGLSRRDAKAASLTLLQSVGIAEPERRLDEYPHQLSGGMRQRIVIAIALACNPKLVIADEPTTALDVTVQAQILDLLDPSLHDSEMSVILITHDMSVVARRTEELIVMYAGRIVERGPTEVLLSEAMMPYTEALLASVPSFDRASHTKLEIIPGQPPDMVHPPQGCRFAPRCRYAQERCAQEEPELVESSQPGHFYRCFHPVGGPQRGLDY